MIARSATVFFVLISLGFSLAFTPITPAKTLTTIHSKTGSGVTTALAASDSDSTTTTTTTTASPAQSLRMPLTWDEMVRQVSTSMRLAAKQGVTRQMVRILLPRDSASQDFGTYVEGQASSSASSSSSSDSNLMDLSQCVLVPPDESWQGGIVQIYRAAAPTAEAILRTVALDLNAAAKTAGLPPRITEDRSVDESGVDGVGLFSSSYASSSKDDWSLNCWLQPTQEVIDDVLDRANKQQSTKNTLTVLMNPQWRQVDDALDTASQGTGFWANVANFLGGKGATQQKLRDNEFQPVYTLEGYICRGANVRLMQTLVEAKGDWAVFCERDNGESYVQVGTSSKRPTYQEVDQMLQDSGIGFKYARDMGMEPKL